MRALASDLALVPIESASARLSAARLLAEAELRLRLVEELLRARGCLGVLRGVLLLGLVAAGGELELEVDLGLLGVVARRAASSSVSRWIRARVDSTSCASSALLRETSRSMSLRFFSMSEARSRGPARSRSRRRNGVREFGLEGLAGAGEFRVQRLTGSGDLGLERRTAGQQLGLELGAGAGRLRLELGARLRGGGLQLGVGLAGRGVQLGASALGVGVQRGVRGGGVLLERDPRILDLTGEVGAALFEVVVELGTQACGLGVERRARLLGLTGERCGLLAGDRRPPAARPRGLGDLALDLRAHCGGLALAGGARLGDLGGDAPRMAAASRRASALSSRPPRSRERPSRPPARGRRRRWLHLRLCVVHQTAGLRLASARSYAISASTLARSFSASMSAWLISRGDCSSATRRVFSSLVPRPE